MKLLLGTALALAGALLWAWQADRLRRRRRLRVVRWLPSDLNHACALQALMAVCSVLHKPKHACFSCMRRSA
jgi:hypothetical protein